MKVTKTRKRDEAYGHASSVLPGRPIVLALDRVLAQTARVSLIRGRAAFLPRGAGALAAAPP